MKVLTSVVFIRILLLFVTVVVVGAGCVVVVDFGYAPFVLAYVSDKYCPALHRSF